MVSQATAEFLRLYYPDPAPVGDGEKQCQQEQAEQEGDADFKHVFGRERFRGVGDHGHGSVHRQ